MTLSTGRALLDAEKILREVGLSEGQTYVDFGCGHLGHFVIPASGLVGPGGQAYAFDILPEVIAAINERARTEKILNLTTVWGDLKHPRGVEKIPAGSLDLVSLVNNTVLLFGDNTTVANVKKVLKNHGLFLLIDWRSNSRLAGVLSSGQADPVQLKSMVLANGFGFVKSITVGKNHFGLLFEKI